MEFLVGRNFVNEIIWSYKTGGASKNHWNRKHDTILFYAYSSKEKIFKQIKEKSYNRDYKRYGFQNVTEYKDDNCNLCHTKLPENLGWYTLSGIRDVWEINALGRSSNERLGYPTQKPVTLLKRIIQASCPENGTVLDPFCGCGTAIEAAHNLGRSWIGIDICKYAIDKIMYRLGKIGLQRQKDYQVYNYPFVFDHIERLLQQKQGRYIFQDWAIEHVKGISNHQKSGDRGIDGNICFFKTPESKELGRMVLSVKSDKKLQAQYIRDLIGTMHNQEAEMAGLISLAEPTEGMKLEAAQAGNITIDMGPWGKQEYPKVQLLTVKEIFAGKRFNTPNVRKW